jgi:2-methylcitrate dehydratase PrpD
VSHAAGRVTDALVRLATTVSPADLTDDLCARATAAAIDTVAVTIAGSDEPAARTLRTTMLDADQLGGRYAVVGSNTGAGLLDAVLCNGVAAHALDFDDTLQGLTTHPSCHVFPALLGLAQHRPAGGHDFLVAYLVGIEAEERLARALNPAHYARGWHATQTLGTIATALACARLLALGADATRAAIGIAASSAAGLRANFGSMVKPLHASHAARAGVEAALLAAGGFDANPQALEHPLGFLAAFDAPAGVAGLPVWDADRDRHLAGIEALSFKPYPCCGEATAAVQAAIELSRSGAADDLAAVEVTIGPFAREMLEFDAPATADQARFSATYCVAAALVRGGLGVRDFTAAALADPAVRDMMERTTVAVAGEGHTPASDVRVRTTGGASAAVHVEVPKGRPPIGFSPADAQEKFRATAGHVLGERRTGVVLEALAGLPGVADAGAIARLLGAA